MLRVRKQSFGHYNLINSYVESLKQDSPPPVTPVEGKNAIKLLECIEESLNEQRPITVDIWKHFNCPMLNDNFMEGIYARTSASYSKV